MSDPFASLRATHGTPTGVLGSGVLPSQTIRQMLERGQIRADSPIHPGLIQPASMDLRLGSVAHRVPASFLPGVGRTVAERLEAMRMHDGIDLTRPAMLERGCVYIVPLQESLTLPRNVYGKTNPKSTTGRLDVFTRVITDHGTAFDQVPAGYDGPLYVEVVPQTFSVIVEQGTRLCQLRLVDADAPVSAMTHEDLHREHPLAFLPDGSSPDHLVSDGLWFTVDLVGEHSGEIVAYRARPHRVVDLSRIGHYDPAEYWEPIRRNAEGTLILNPGDFYILVSRERVRVPLGYAAEMAPFETPVGEFRVHYAGFFDPGFGYVEGSPVPGTPGVLEVRCREAPFLLEHGQVVGRLLYEALTEPSTVVYGRDIGSNYQGQGLKLAKQFRSV